MILTKSILEIILTIMAVIIRVSTKITQNKLSQELFCLQTCCCLCFL